MHSKYLVKQGVSFSETKRKNTQQPVTQCLKYTSAIKQDLVPFCLCFKKKAIINYLTNELVKRSASASQSRNLC